LEINKMGRVAILNSTGTEVITPASQTDIQAIVTQLITALALPTGAATSAGQASLLAAVEPLTAVVGVSYALVAADTPEQPISASTVCRGLILSTPKGTDGVTGTNTTTISILAPVSGGGSYVKIVELPPDGGSATLNYSNANMLWVQGATIGDTVNIGIVGIA
jgi:hypothetical protein